MTIDEVRQLADAIRREIAHAVVGQDDAVELMLIALLASGHILLEGPPGTAKTFLAQCFARAVGIDYGRIQFTPDLMPGDVIGANIFNFQTTQAFSARTRGPIFCERAARRRDQPRPAQDPGRPPPGDERAHASPSTAWIHPARPTSSSSWRRRHPIEQQGTYPLPEAQLDRFLFKHQIRYPDAAEERRIVAAHGHRFGTPRAADWGVSAVAIARRSMPRATRSRASGLPTR